MSENYKIRVLRKEGNELDLEVTLLHPDAGGFPTAKNFGLQLVYEPIDEDDDEEDPLWRAVADLGGEGVPLEPDWLMENTDRLVSSFELISTRNYPPPVNPKGIDYGYILDPENPAVAIYRIILHKAEWLTHFEVDQQWDTACFDKLEESGRIS